MLCSPVRHLVCQQALMSVGLCLAKNNEPDSQNKYTLADVLKFQVPLTRPSNCTTRSISLMLHNVIATDLFSKTKMAAGKTCKSEILLI